MKQIFCKVAFPARVVVLTVMFLTTMFFVNADSSFAATAKKKSPDVVRTSAVEHSEAQIKQLQGALNITEAQEALWNNLALVMRENAKDMDALSKERSEHIKTMNAVERMKFHSQTTEAQFNQLNKLIPPFEALYSGMSDEQRTITDTIFRTGKHEKRKLKK